MKTSQLSHRSECSAGIVAILGLSRCRTAVATHPNERPIMAKRLVDLMLDSGAFTMWNRGITLNVRDYIAWLIDRRDLFYSYVVLDIIPGKFGSKLSGREVARSAKGTYDNQRKMKERGLNPIPVFHQGEPFSWLERYMDDGEPYIGVGTNKATPEEDQTRWLDKIFTALTDNRGNPLVKVHGFGITRPSLMMRYPWFSTDSTTWALTPSFGQLWIPVFKDGKPDYTQAPMQGVFSDVERLQKSGQNKVDGWGPTTMKAIKLWLDHCGVSLVEARYDPNRRRWMMLKWFTEFQEAWEVGPFRNRGGSLTLSGFDNKKANWKATGQLQIHLATNLSRNWAKMMNEAGAFHRLLNYHELRDKPRESIENFVTKGMVGEPRHVPIKPDFGMRHMSAKRIDLANRYKGDENASE
jgi:hypothetical protein